LGSTLGVAAAHGDLNLNAGRWSSCAGEITRPGDAEEKSSSSEVSSEICSAPTSMPPPPPSAPPSRRALDICGWQGVRGGDEQPAALGERFLMGRTESVYLGRVVHLLQSSVPFSLSSVGCRTGGDAASDVPPK